MNKVNKSVPPPVLVILIFWLTTLFTGFGLLAPPNRTVIASLAIFAVSVSSAIFLILELFSPYTGLIKVFQRSLSRRARGFGQVT